MARRRSARVVARIAAATAARATRAAVPARRRRRPIRTITPPPFVPPQVFPLLLLPAELTLHIATYLTTRTALAMLLASSEFAHLSTIFNILSRKDHTVIEHGCVHVYTPLQFFSSRGIESIVTRLLKEGADPNDVSYGRPKNQLSPLVHAIGYHSASIVSLLIRHGAQVNRRDGGELGYFPLDIAVGRPHQVHPRLLHDRRGYDTRAAELPQIVKLLLDAGADVNTEHRRRGTPLHIACAAVNADPLIVANLIAGGANVHARFNEFLSLQSTRGLAGDIQPIHYAAGAGHAAIVQLLLDAGADIEAQTRNGIRPLDNAFLKLSTEVYKLLIAAGADATTNSAQCYPITTRSRELNRLLSDAREFSGVPNPLKLLRKKEARPADLLRWLDLRGCRPNPGQLGVWRMPLYLHRRNLGHEELAFLSM